MSQPGRLDIWITGVAALTALGRTLDATWEAMLAGRTSGRRVELCTPGGVRVRVPAAPVDGDLLDDIPLESSSERADRMALQVARQAVASAGLDPPQLAPAAVVFGSSKPAIGSWFVRAVMGRPRADGAPRVTGPMDGPQGPPTWDMLTPQRAAVLVAGAVRAHGAVLSSVAACSTGLHSLVRAVQWLRDGCGPVAITGSVESSLNPLFAASFLQMRVLAAQWDDPRTACRPFDRNRSGFIIGEGAAALVLETPEHARARGAKPLAVIEGYALGSDPTGLAELDPAGRPLASTIRRCLGSAGVRPDQVACVKAHGTATVQNDPAETAAIAAILGYHSPPVISLKGYLGHTLGASGAIETAICVKSLECGMIPGNANLQDPDPACGPNLPNTPTALPSAGGTDRVLCLSAGFGGHLAAVLIRRG